MSDADLSLLLERSKQILDRLGAIEARLTALEEKVDRHADENAVLSGMAMRIAGEHIAWGRLQSQVNKIMARLDALEQRKP